MANRPPTQPGQQGAQKQSNTTPATPQITEETRVSHINGCGTVFLITGPTVHVNIANYDYRNVPRTNCASCNDIPASSNAAYTGPVMGNPHSSHPQPQNSQGSGLAAAQGQWTANHMGGNQGMPPHGTPPFHPPFPNSLMAGAQNALVHHHGHQGSGMALNQLNQGQYQAQFLTEAELWASFLKPSPESD